MIENIKNMLEEQIKVSGYILDDVKLEKEDNNLFLRIIIDKAGTVDVNDCVNVTKIINPILDSNDPIKENYILDVCSKERGE